MASLRDLTLSRKARKYGASFSLRIIWEARRAGLPISAGFALVEKESAFRNVFGHDPTPSIPESWKGSEVTKAKYETYKRNRKAGRGMQGVGPTQLTWYEFQDRADALGGCWKTSANIRVGLGILGGYYKSYKAKHFSTETALRLAARDYNGTGPAADAYGRDFIVRYDKWHRRLA